MKSSNERLGTLNKGWRSSKDVKKFVQQIKARLLWMQEGNTSITREFFFQVKLIPNRKWIFILKSEDEIVVSSKQLFEYVCYNFYKKIYKTQKVSTQEEEELRAMILNSLPKRFFEAVNVKIGLQWILWSCQIDGQRKSPQPRWCGGWVLLFFWGINKHNTFSMICLAIKEG